MEGIFSESGKFSKMVEEFAITKSTIMFKINLFMLVKKYPKLKNLSLSMNYFKRLFKQIEFICKTTGRNFKSAEKDYAYIYSIVFLNGCSLELFHICRIELSTAVKRFHNRETFRCFLLW